MIEKGRSSSCGPLGGNPCARLACLGGRSSDASLWRCPAKGIVHFGVYRGDGNFSDSLLAIFWARIT